MAYLIGGTVTGALFAISALALVLTYKTSRVFNFAQGGEAYFIAYVYYELVAKAHLSPMVALPIAVLGCGGLLGYLLWWFLFRHLAHRTQMVRLTATIGLQVAIVAATTVIFGTNQVVQEVGIVHGTNAVVYVFGVGLNGNQLWVLGSGALIAIGAAVVLHRTRLGITVRGVVDSSEMSAGLGINPNVVSAGSCVVGTILVALTGILLVPVLGLNAGGYQTLIAASFAAAILGRLSSLGITFIAGLCIGILQSVLVPILPPSGVLGTGLPASLPFIIIIVTLVVWGVLGRAPREAVESAQWTSSRSQAPPTGPGSWDRYAGWAVAVVAVFALPHILSAFWLALVAGSVALGIALLSWRVITGEAGIISLAQVSLAALGGSVAAKVAIEAHLSVSLAILVGAAAAAVVGLVLGALVLPLGPLYAALATFGFGLFADNMLLQNTFFDQYSAGLPLARPSIGPISTTGAIAFFYAALVVFVIVAWLLRNLRQSTRGMILAAVRSRPGRAATLGIHVTATRLFSFAVASFIAGLGGALYASYQGNALPDSLTTSVGLVWFAVMMLMGVRSIGAAIGAGLGLVLIPEILTRYTNATVSNILPLLFGLGAIHLAKQPTGAATLMRARMRRLAIVAEEHVPGWLVRARPRIATAWPRGISFKRAPSAAVATGGAVDVMATRAPLPAASNGASDGAVPSPSNMEALGAPGSGDGREPSLEVSEFAMEARGVSVSFSGVRALSDVDFQVAPGSIVGLMGPNGAGKTTLLGVLSGLQKLDRGEVYCSARRITGTSPAKRAALGVARTFQVPALCDDLTVGEHLLLAHRMRTRCWDVWRDLAGARSRRPTLAESTAVEGLLSRLGLLEMGDTYPVELPLGSQRLIEVAQSVMMQPSILLLDEPSAGLDTMETESFRQVLEALRRESGLAVVLVEHDLQFILRASDEVVVLKFGTVLARGRPDKVRENPEVMTAYLGEPARSGG